MAASYRFSWGSIERGGRGGGSMEGSRANLTALVPPWVVGARGGGLVEIGIDSLVGKGLGGLGGRGGGGGRSEV